MSILDAVRYAELLTRKEVKEGLEKGHPLIPGFVLADRAKQIQQTDAIVQALEQQAGLKPPGQTIVDELEAYLRNPNPPPQQPRHAPPPGGPQGGPPGGPPGGPRPPMPQGGPPGAGGPMPGPQAPGGAGGAMPGMPQGPPGAGGPMMASGGIIPRYQEGSVVEEEDDVFGPFNDPWIYGTDWLRPKDALDYALLGGSLAALGTGVGAPGTVAGIGGYGLRKAAMGLGRAGLKRVAPRLGSTISQTIGKGITHTGTKLDPLLHPFRSVSGTIGSITPFGKTSIGEFVGKPLARWSTKGGIRGGISNLLTGGPGRIAPGASSIPAEIFGTRAGARALLGAQGLNMLGYGDTPGDDTSALAQVGGEEGGVGGPGGPGGPGGAGGIGGGIASGRGDYGSWLENEIRALRTLASTPTPEEEAYYKVLADRERELSGQRDRYRAAGQKSAQADALMGVSEYLGRRGRPDQITMGGVGALMREGARGRQEYMDELGQSAFDVGSLGSEQRAARSVAGRELLNTELQAKIEDRKAEHRMREVMAQIAGQNPQYQIQALVTLLEQEQLYGDPEGAAAKAIQRQLYQLVGMSAEDLQPVDIEDALTS